MPFHVCVPQPPRIRHQRVRFFRRAVKSLSQTVAQIPKNHSRGRYIAVENINSLMIQTNERLLESVLDIGHVQMNDRLLADPVEPSDALLDKLRIKRKVEQHEILTELEVPSLAPDFAANEHARAVLLRKPGCVAVALNDGHVFMEQRDFYCVKP